MFGETYIIPTKGKWKFTEHQSKEKGRLGEHYPNTHRERRDTGINPPK